MKFEEVLPLMRDGKKARHARMRDGEYWTCGYSSIEASDKWLTLIKVFDNAFDCDRDSYAWGIERWAVMMDGWEVVD
jgi:hypothetical protein